MQAFSPYGDLVNVKVLAGKGCGLVTYSNRASAEEATRMLKGSQMGGNTARLSWAHLSANKQDQQNGYYARLNCFDPSGSGWSLQFGSEGCGFFQLGNFSEDMMNDGQITFMGAGLVLKRGFSGTASGNGGLEKKFWQWIEQMYSKLFLEMAYDRPTGRMSRISICAVAYNAICQAFKDLYDLYLMLVYVASRYSPDSWDEPLRDARPFGESILQHSREERSLDFRGGVGVPLVSFRLEYTLRLTAKHWIPRGSSAFVGWSLCTMDCCCCSYSRNSVISFVVPCAG
ncbi:hypothetical protein PVAP13_2KG000600 [Panicum virgatum]|nr:hypothetical protein PVAP13_2KG000600 [Panicum virgatum]